MSSKFFHSKNFLPDKNISTPFAFIDILFSFLFIAGVFFTIQHLPVQQFFSDLPIPASIKILFIFLIQEIIFILPVLFLIFFRYKVGFLQSLFIRRFPFVKGIGNIIKWYLFYLLASLIINSVLAFFNIHIPGYGEGKNILPLFGDDQYSLLVVIFVALIIAPLIEELFFRGFLFMTLLKKYGYVLATIVASVIFAFIHFDFSAFIPRFLLGLILNHLVIENNKSIVPSFLFHLLNNGIALIISFIIK